MYDFPVYISFFVGSQVRIGSFPESVIWVIWESLPVSECWYHGRFIVLEMVVEMYRFAVFKWDRWSIGCEVWYKKDSL